MYAPSFRPYDIICNVTDSCSDQIFNCLHNIDCNIYCISDESCYSTQFYCPNNGHYASENAQFNAIKSLELNV